MPSRLQALSDSIDLRFTLYRRMSANLGLDLTEAQARTHRADLRTALLSCAACGETCACAAWLDQGHPAVPEFCRARGAFLRLPAARLRVVRRSRAQNSPSPPR